MMAPLFPRPISQTVRGIHWSASTDHSSALGAWPYWAEQLRAMGIGWVKLLDDGNGSSVQLCMALLTMGVIPIVRLYRPRPNPGHLPAAHMDTVRRLVGIGVRYFEPNNEPNLADEWDGDKWAQTTWQERVQLAVEYWLSDAVSIIEAGGLPGFPALAQCAHKMTETAIGSIPFYEEAFRHLAELHKEAARDLFDAGAWLAVHDAVLNHCYQDNSAWHFEYPYDPICQATDPGKTILQDDCSLIGHRAAEKLLQSHLGADLHPPVISTEGGVFMPKGGWTQPDTRYPGYDYQGQATRTVAMFDWLAPNAPEVYAMCPWLIANERMGHNNPAWTEDAWYHKDVMRPVVDAMRASVPVPPTTEPDIREEAWNQAGQAYNPDAAFQKYATANALGVPMTPEFDVGTIRAQGFANAIVYCTIGDWAKIHEMPW